MKILLVASTTGYQIRSFADAAERVGATIVLATDRCHVLDNPWGDDAVAVRFEEPAASATDVAARGPFDGILAVGDRPALAAAFLARTLGMRFSPPDAVRAAGNKLLARIRFQLDGLLTPHHALEQAFRFPCVLKPLDQSASKGVIRVDDQAGFVAAHARIKALTANAAVLVEDFIPGDEFALEGLVTGGVLQVLAIFDKPDPLDGPYFEESIYVTPSRQPDTVQRAIRETAQRAVTALGLTNGPVHAEMRVNDRGVWMLEVAARPIGGLCSRVLRFDGGTSLEELLLRHAAGEDVTGVRLDPGAHGVMMLPVPGAGMITSVDGIDQARGVPGIEDVVITAKAGQQMLPWPEGSSYPGFLFARAETPHAAENALRAAHACLKFHMAAALPVVK
ncbi:MAG TPA: ATP-grasp domain-containing protein [Bryobacteraceae bacterium]|jgi:biotin carboxylase|nr:ATP-grasp domain-containing protein [Bryobacteraceae bacterium]